MTTTLTATPFCDLRVIAWRARITVGLYRFCQARACVHSVCKYNNIIIIIVNVFILFSTPADYTSANIRFDCTRSLRSVIQAKEKISVFLPTLGPNHRF